MYDPREEKLELNIEAFGQIVDEFLERNHVQMLIDIPKGTLEPGIKDNIHMGGVMQFYILLRAMVPIYKSMVLPMLDPEKEENFIDGILGMVKADLMEAASSAGERRDGDD